MMIRPSLQNPPILQQLGIVDDKALAICDQLLLILPDDSADEQLAKLPSGDILQGILAKSQSGSTPAFVTRISGERQTLIVAGTLKKEASAFDQLTLGRKLVAAACQEKAGNLGIAVIGHDDASTIYSNMLAAALAAAFELPTYKTKKPPALIESIVLIGAEDEIDTTRVGAEALGNNLARWLASMPPNKLNAVSYTELIRELARERGWDFQRLDTGKLTKLGAGAFLAVAQGNEDDSAGIVRLRYGSGKKNEAADLGLVGKGIIFDTGGNNLKPFQSMLEMHGDMQGSAVALGALLAIDEMQLPITVDCWLAITENRIGPKAYKSQDVVSAANGKTIQAIHTDAEGRMALADTLVLASRENPGILFDFATLTGTCVSAITTRYSGVFTNRPDLHPGLKRTGQNCGERVWPFPIGEEFMEDLKSNTADFKQCSPKASGDHILAASFLAEFIENDVPWVHMDLSASDTENGLGHIASKFTGFGVRYTMSVILDENLFKANT